MAYHLPMSGLPGAKRGAGSRVPLSPIQLHPHNAALSVSGGELEPIPWSQQMSAMGLDTLGGLSSSRAAAGEQCFTSSTDWLQPPCFVEGRTETDSLEPELFQSHSIPWASSSISASESDGTHLAVDGTSYPLAPLDPESTTDVFSATPGQHYELARPPGYRVQLAGEADSLCNGKKRGVLLDTCAGDETWRRKRIRSPPIRVRTGGLDADLPRYIPSPVLRRDSTFGISSTMSSPENTAAPAFDIIVTYPPSNGSRTGTTIPSPSPDVATDERRPPRPRRRASGSITTTTTTNAGGKNKPTLQARNRAAASRYRAKTQAAFAQLEADERDASVRHQSLLACAGELRDEVFRLKTELLRHASCDCPLIRGYLSRAAEDVCKGWVSRKPGSGSEAGLEPKELEGVSEEVSEGVVIAWRREGGGKHIYQD